MPTLLGCEIQLTLRTALACTKAFTAVIKVFKRSLK